MAKVNANSPDKTTQRPKKNKKQGKATSKEKPSVGKTLQTKHPEIEQLKQRLDFKARLIPLMYLASIDKIQSDFSIKEIQNLIFDALGEQSNVKQIEDVFNRRTDWFEKTQANPRRYKLLEIGYDYAKNILFY